MERVPQGGLIYEVKIGALMHDVPLAGSSKEPSGVDLNLEVIFGPSVPILYGTIRPALGATINFAGYTSKAYLDARWQVECCWGAFFSVVAIFACSAAYSSWRPWQSCCSISPRAATPGLQSHCSWLVFFMETVPGCATRLGSATPLRRWSPLL